jgi:hypothetical protein
MKLLLLSLIISMGATSAQIQSPAGNSPGKYIPRTMALLESATPQQRTPVRILFYGQSIIGSGYADIAIRKHLNAKYPNAEVEIRNAAIGGYEAPKLSKTSWADLYPFYPDLVVFHVYGGRNGELEEIFRNIRTYTTAEVLTWTHHVDNLGIDEQRDKDADWQKELATKYGQEIVDVRLSWKQYLKDTGKQPEDLLGDQKIHLNQEGGALLGRLLVAHFQACPTASRDWEQRVKTFRISEPHPEIKFDEKAWEKSGDGRVSTASRPLRFNFTGNRVDLIGLLSVPGAGTAKILVDGQAPSQITETYAVSRSSTAPGVWWPAVDRVILGRNPVTEQYTMAFHDVTPDGRNYRFDLRGEATGDEGAGRTGEDFVSKSGRIRIHAADIGVETVRAVLQKDLPPNFNIKWKTYTIGKDVWQFSAIPDNGLVDQSTVIQLKDSGTHLLEVIPNGDGPVGIHSIMVYNPSAG